VIFYIFSLNLVAAQTKGSITGRIIDGETGEGLPAVNVMVKGTYYGAATDLQGYYKIEKVNPGGMSVATSGDYEKYFELDGKRYHHILNPETGYPADSLISVTVLNKSCTIADAFATAVFVLGQSKGLRLIENLPGTEAMIIDNQMIINRK
jgi:hypothetical protein